MSGEEVAGALDGGMLGSIAEKLGVDKERTPGLIASILPSIGDRLAPNEKVENGA